MIKRDYCLSKIDFIYLKNPNGNPIVIECKWSANQLNPKSFHRFRKLHKSGENYLVANDIDREYTINSDGLIINCVSIIDLIEKLKH